MLCCAAARPSSKLEQQEQKGKVAFRCDFYGSKHLLSLMQLRMRRASDKDDNEGNVCHDLSSALARNAELEALTYTLRHSLELSHKRENMMMDSIIEMGGKVPLDLEMQGSIDNEQQCEKYEYGTCPMEKNVNFVTSFIERAGWLVGLLIFQSFSSIILSSNTELLSRHPTVIFFLTMLVGAGGVP